MGGTRDDELCSNMAILGLLIERPDTARGLERRLAARFSADRFVESTGYNALRRLRALEYVCFQNEAQTTQPADAAAHGGRARVRLEAGVGGEPIRRTVLNRRGVAGLRKEPKRYVATPAGVDAFERWLGTASAAPALREDLRGKIAFLKPSDLPRMIQIVREEERICAAEFETVHACIDALDAYSGNAAALPPVAERGLEAGGGLHTGRGEELIVRSGRTRWTRRMELLLLRDEATVWLTRRQRLERMRAYLEDLLEELRRTGAGQSPRPGR